MSDLEALSRPFPQRYIKQPPKGKYGQYVPHDIVNQKLLAVLGPFDFHVTEIIRSGENNQVEAVICRLTATVDGQRVTVEEVGDCEVPSNWKTEGGRLKDAISDALKRCAMRLGCGLHLWSGSDYDLYDILRKQQQVATDNKDAEEPTRGNDPSVPAARPGGGADAGTQPPTQADADPAPSPEPLRLGGAG
jgi:hypothetical protein